MSPIYPRCRFVGMSFTTVFRSLGALIVTIVAAALAAHLRHFGAPATSVGRWVSLVAFIVAGSGAVRWTAHAVGQAVTRRTILAAGAVVRFVLTGVGYVVLLISSLALAGVSWQRLLIGAGVVSVVLGIAAQQSLANIFASLVLLLGRAFNVGDSIIIRSGTLGTLQCTVRAIGLTYVTVETETGLVKIPNAVLSASAIGKIAGL